MKIAELSRSSGVSIATIKYYLREGLLPPGRTTAPNQADYSATHLHRLTLIRTLVDVGRLSISSVRAVIAAIDEKKLSLHDTLGVAHDALPPLRPETIPDGDFELALTDVNEYIERLGWTGSDTSPARYALAQALVSLRRLGRDCGPEVFDLYAHHANDLATREIASLPSGEDRDRAVEEAVVGTVVFEAALTALRRLAEAHHSAIRFS
ncbi:MAG TPA: MerR family transcriptional regulator [Acidimicrobiales bacterium]|nr:MerR family transcriptional regulator [Acidimicrobiales bacterium]